MRNASGNLTLIAFDVSNNGIVSRSGDSGGSGAVTETSLMSLGNGRIVVAVRENTFLSLKLYSVASESII